MRLDQDNSTNVRTACERALRSSFPTRGAQWARFIGVFLVLAGFMATGRQVHAQNIVRVSGWIPAGQTMMFNPRDPNNSADDYIYWISGDLHVDGKLQISEGAEVWFLDNSRIVDSIGGKIIANGYAGLPGKPSLNRQILFRGSPEGDTSYEWGHIDVLPGSDSAFFANCRFTNFNKRNTVDDSNWLPFNINFGNDANYDPAFSNAANGTGAVICTFSQKTFIYNCIVDSCRASFAGGAFAFLQSPAKIQNIPAFSHPDDGRIALRNRQVAMVTVRDTRVFNHETSPLPTNTLALGGAIYMASNSPTYVAADSVTAYLGHNGFSIVPAPNDTVVKFVPTQDVFLFERCTANNTFGAAANFAEGGAIYVGTNSQLVLEQATFNNDSAIMPSATNDLNSWGGAIAVNAFSGSPAQNPQDTGALGALPGLAVLKTATFNGNCAGVGGAIYMGYAGAGLGAGIPAPRLLVDAENTRSFVPGFIGAVRDSGNILFTGNIAYTYGGAIYSQNQVHIRGYLAPQDYPWPGGPYSVEMRVKFFNNVAGEGGGSVFLDGFGLTGGVSGGTPDIHERRSWHLQNSVNPGDVRVNRPDYVGSVLGGGAEFVGFRDSTFATEYNSNFVIGGNGGGVEIEDGISCGQQTPVNRFFVDNEFNAKNVTVPRDTGTTPTGDAIYSIFPFDQRELTRFVNNAVYLGPDSATLFNYDPSATNTAHGRGGGLYIRITGDPCLLAPVDSTFLSRVRFEHNEAYSGSAIWSDNYDLKIMSNQTLIANNIATSTSSATVDLDQSGVANPGDPNAGATIWGDFEGPAPSFESNSRGDAIYDNQARYILRLPISRINGLSGVDTLRGNFWGETGAAIQTEEHPPTGVIQSTFFIDYYKGCYANIYEPNSNPPISYRPDAIGTVPDTLLMEGRVYDLYDRGTDMKVADYSNRRLAPAEAFSLAEPANIAKMHRFTRNIFDTNLTYTSKIDLYQTDMMGNHPIGYPLFLQADVPIADSNRDDFARDYTTFIVLNTTTNEFVRVNLKEIEAAEASGDNQQTYQGRLDFIPDSSVAERHPNLRSTTLYSLSLLRPTSMTFAEVQRASMLEDSAALKGREYGLSANDLLATGDSVFFGCSGLDQPSQSKWYAGEKYHTLPVRPGDHIIVISRTVLWKYGAAAALVQGLNFFIGDVQQPAFVGDIPNLQADPYNPNVRFVKRDVNYDGSTAAKTLFRVAGYDANNFYDPRFLFNPGNYTQLALTVTPDLFKGDVVPTGGSIIAANALDSVENHIRLTHWLKQKVDYNANIGGSNGYILLYGMPHNPDIVPGGEWLTATVTNFPPNCVSEGGLLSSIPGSQLGPDSNALSMWLYPPSMNCDRVPDTSIANPDSLDIRSTSVAYHFRIIVQDSVPVFDSLHVACGFSYPVGILTDSLRYTVDLNTDVEREDDAAAAETEAAVHVGDNNSYPAWDFRYGRSSYNFAVEPSWMVEPQGGVYIPIDSADPSFLRSGKIMVRLDSQSAVGGNWSPGGVIPSYLLPFPQNNGALNLDTVMGVTSDDGHTGKTMLSTPVTILFAPTILSTDSLPDAKQGVDYSINFNNADSVKRIQVQNLNPEQPYTYALIYQGQTDTLYRDFPDKVPEPTSYGPNGAPIYTAPHTVGGSADMVVGQTPRWLTIDPFSGVLTGVPGDSDAPRTTSVPCGPDTITVVVSNGTQNPNGQTLNYCVAAWTTLTINVDSMNHAPHIVKGPTQLCIMNGTVFCDSVTVYDPDLRRGPCGAETVTLTDDSIPPTGTVTINDTVGSQGMHIVGQINSDSVTFKLCASFNESNTDYFNQLPLEPEIIRLIATDASGLTDTIRIPVHLGEQPKFECGICVSNAITGLQHPMADMQQLYFGAATDAHDTLDQLYCEYELAPLPPTSVFDARWDLPDTAQGQSFGLEGTTVDVRQAATGVGITWLVSFQPGDETGSAGSLYPVQICWRPSCLDTATLVSPFSQGFFYLRDPNSSQEFSINMMNGQGPIDNSLYTLIKVNADSDCLQIRNQDLKSAEIVFEPSTSGVSNQAAPVFAIQPNYPNPFPASTTINFSVAARSDVRIDIYDVKGTLVRTLVNEPLDAGSYPVTWDGSDASGAPVPDGTYFANMHAGSFSGSVKMSLEHGAQ